MGQLRLSLASVSPPEEQRLGPLGLLPIQPFWAPWPWNWAQLSRWSRVLVGPSRIPSAPRLLPEKEGRGQRSKSNCGLQTPTLLGLSSWDCLGRGGRELGADMGAHAGPVNVIQAATSWTSSCPELAAPEAGVGVGASCPLAPDCGQLSFEAEMEWGRGRKYP